MERTLRGLEAIGHKRRQPARLRGRCRDRASARFLRQQDSAGGCQAMDEMRRLLEVEVAASCATGMPARAIDQMSRNLSYQRAAVDSGDFAGFHELDTIGK